LCVCYYPSGGDGTHFQLFFFCFSFQKVQLNELIIPVAEKCSVSIDNGNEEKAAAFFDQSPVTHFQLATNETDVVEERWRWRRSRRRRRRRRRKGGRRR